MIEENQVCDKCVCPGWCSRHKRHKSPHLVHLCHTRPDYRALWDAKAKSGNGVTPSRFVKVSRYVRAVSRWIAAGCPVRLPEEVIRVFQGICSQCPKDQFDIERKVCKKCGCKVSLNCKGLLNKIRMETEHCPEGLW